MSEETVMNNPWKLTACALALALVGAVAGGASRVAFADESNLQHALDALHGARYALEYAQDDKDGHRAKAIKLTDQAIAEAKAAVDSARTH
jgi:hypothetical protein